MARSNSGEIPTGRGWGFTLEGRKKRGQVDNAQVYISFTPTDGEGLQIPYIFHLKVCKSAGGGVGKGDRLADQLCPEAE